MSDLTKLQKLLDKEYRDSFLESHVKGSIAYQIQALRENEDLNQTDFGKLIGKPQSVVSRLEDTEYGGVNINTLLQIASALQIGLEVRFCDFRTVLKADVSPDGLKVENIHETIKKELAISAATHFVAQIHIRPAQLFVENSASFIQEVKGSTPWQTNLPNQPQTSWFPGSGTLNSERFMPIPV